MPRLSLLGSRRYPGKWPVCSATRLVVGDGSLIWAVFTRHCVRIAGARTVELARLLVGIGVMRLHPGRWLRHADRSTVIKISHVKRTCNGRTEAIRDHVVPGRAVMDAQARHLLVLTACLHFSTGSLFRLRLA